jgi:2'-5' RNA ligase
MRLFVAIDLDEAARQAIAGEQKRLMRVFGRQDRSLRWVQVDQMHLTLVFIGHVDEERGARIADMMSAEIRLSPFTMSFGRVGVFPPHGAPNVLWLGVAAGAQEAVDLQRVVADRLEPAGVERERRAYYPHLTLARWRMSRSADRVRALDASRDQEVARVTVDSVTLYQSRLSPAGATYVALARAPLRS